MFQYPSTSQFSPAIKIIGCATSEIFNGLYLVFTESDEH